MSTGQVAHHPRRRWPRTADPAAAPAAELQLNPNDLAPVVGAAVQKAIGDLSGVLSAMVPIVLDVESILLDASGTGQIQFRLPYRSVVVYSFSAQKVTVTNSPLASGAPTRGPGMAVIPANGWRVVNFSGPVLSVYGGTANDVVGVETFGIPMPPAGGKLA